jgi:hypothetical protein
MSDTWRAELVLGGPGPSRCKIPEVCIREVLPSTPPTSAWIVAQSHRKEKQT